MSFTFPFPIGVDVNECESEDYPCDVETEDCENLLGSFRCSCKDGMEYSNGGKCVPTLKTKKKSKKSKKNQKPPIGTSSTPSQASGADVESPDADKHRVPPWYSTLVPLVVCVFVYKNCKPNLYTSIGILTTGILVAFFVI